MSTHFKDNAIGAEFVVFGNSSTIWCFNLETKQKNSIKVQIPNRENEIKSISFQIMSMNKKLICSYKIQLINMFGRPIDHVLIYSLTNFKLEYQTNSDSYGKSSDFLYEIPQKLYFLNAIDKTQRLELSYLEVPSYQMANKSCWDIKRELGDSDLFLCGKNIIFLKKNYLIFMNMSLEVLHKMEIPDAAANIFQFGGRSEFIFIHLVNGSPNLILVSLREKKICLEMQPYRGHAHLPKSSLHTINIKLL